MKISSINNKAGVMQNFNASLNVTSSAYSHMQQAGKLELFQRAAGIFAKRLHLLDNGDRVELTIIDPKKAASVFSEWTPGVYYTKHPSVNKEDLLMRLNNYHECGFFLNPTRDASTIASDMMATYNNLLHRII